MRTEGAEEAEKIHNEETEGTGTNEEKTLPVIRPASESGPGRTTGSVFPSYVFVCFVSSL